MLIDAETAPSSDRLLDQPLDDVVDRLTLRAGGEGQGHAMLERGLGEIRHVLERGGETPIDERLRANSEHEGLRCARPRSPADPLRKVGIALARPRRPDEI